MHVDEAVIELVWMGSKARKGGGDGVLSIDHIDVKRVEAPVARSFSPEQAAEALILGPASEGVVGSMNDCDSDAALYCREEVGLCVLAPALAVVVEDKDIICRRSLGVLEDSAGGVSDLYMEEFRAYEEPLEGLVRPLPVVAVSYTHLTLPTKA